VRLAAFSTGSGAGLEELVPSHFEKLAGRRRSPHGFIRDSWERASRRDRYAKFSVITGHFDRAETEVRPRTGPCETISSELI
jgi:hypothetical protein